MNMLKIFNVGDEISGYCNGYFGRDDYEDKICVMVTSKYAIFQFLEGDMNGFATVLNYEDGLEVSVNGSDKWKKG